MRLLLASLLLSSAVWAEEPMVEVEEFNPSVPIAADFEEWAEACEQARLDLQEVSKARLKRFVSKRKLAGVFTAGPIDVEIKSLKAIVKNPGKPGSARNRYLTLPLVPGQIGVFPWLDEVRIEQILTENTALVRYHHEPTYYQADPGEVAGDLYDEATAELQPEAPRSRQREVYHFVLDGPTADLTVGEWVKVYGHFFVTRETVNVDGWHQQFPKVRAMPWRELEPEWKKQRDRIRAKN